MAEAKTATRPARGRKTEAAKGAKATPKAKPAEAAAEVESTETPAAEPTKVGLVLDHHPDGDTKSYARFVPPAGSGCVGTFYAPPGTTEVRVLLISE